MDDLHQVPPHVVLVLRRMLSRDRPSSRRSSTTSNPQKPSLVLRRTRRAPPGPPPGVESQGGSGSRGGGAAGSRVGALGRFTSRTRRGASDVPVPGWTTSVRDSPSYSSVQGLRRTEGRPGRSLSTGRFVLMVVGWVRSGPARCTPLPHQAVPAVVVCSRTFPHRSFTIVFMIEGFFFGTWGR